MNNEGEGEEEQQYEYGGDPSYEDEAIIGQSLEPLEVDDEQIEDRRGQAQRKEDAKMALIFAGVIGNVLEWVFQLIQLD